MRVVIGRRRRRVVPMHPWRSDDGGLGLVGEGVVMVGPRALVKVPWGTPVARIGGELGVSFARSVEWYK